MYMRQGYLTDLTGGFRSNEKVFGANCGGKVLISWGILFHKDGPMQEKERCVRIAVGSTEPAIPHVLKNALAQYKNTELSNVLRDQTWTDIRPNRSVLNVNLSSTEGGGEALSPAYRLKYINGQHMYI